MYTHAVAYPINIAKSWKMSFTSCTLFSISLIPCSRSMMSASLNCRSFSTYAYDIYMCVCVCVYVCMCVCIHPALVFDPLLALDDESLAELQVVLNLCI